MKPSAKFAQLGSRKKRSTSIYFAKSFDCSKLYFLVKLLSFQPRVMLSSLEWKAVHTAAALATTGNQIY